MNKIEHNQTAAGSHNVRENYIRITSRPYSDGYAAYINGHALVQFDNPLEPYVFSKEHSAVQAAKQLAENQPNGWRNHCRAFQEIETAASENDPRYRSATEEAR